uniref:Uncharacterized protein n=1 Tax=Maylandia zebra TaxID=106582 RepID=A0A3P9BPW0_9CICH
MQFLLFCWSRKLHTFLQLAGSSTLPYCLTCPPSHVTRANATEVTATIAKQTFRPPNTWLDWITYTASVSNMTDCVACSAACPTLFTVPVPLLFWENRPGIDCMLPLPPRVLPIQPEKPPPPCPLLPVPQAAGTPHKRRAPLLPANGR